ncbi:MAG: hypothetical protein ACN6OB_13455 [Chryseobacterium jejuense]|uniref:hypothetical protein n=1 Tax=Chryseobacterium jejuense TaxID=445960 RepID=UPI003D1276B4
MLICGQTFSSAADLANAFKFYKAGKIIGSESGGFIFTWRSYRKTITQFKIISERIICKRF